MRRHLSLAAAVVLVLLAAARASAGPAQIVIVNLNAPNAGFNDPTPATPVGGNTGTTLGEQRLIAFRYAAQLWADRLDSTVPIRIRAQFTALGSGVLGSAGPVNIVRDFANAPLPNTWYHVALANKLAGVDLVLPSATGSGDDINANFSSTFNFYLGIDNRAPAGQPDLVAVLLHEFAHGLGFSQFASLSTGALAGSDATGRFPDVYNSRLFDTTLGLYWPQMTNAQRSASATRFARVVWDGAFVTAGIPSVLSFGSPEVQVTAPSAIAGSYQFGTAAFGPRIGNPDVQAQVVAAVDAVEPAVPPSTTPGTSTDGCSPFLNAAAVAGKIVLIERGFCGFAVKARNATNAGAIGTIIYNNLANVNAGPPGMANDLDNNGAFVQTPTVSLRRADGLAVAAEAASGSAQARIGVDLTIRAGADASGRARVFAPFPVQGGSSISHYDSVASRNLLMEPAINADLTHQLEAPSDLTYELMRDIGWYPDADGDLVADDQDCNPNSDFSPTIVIGGRDTGVPNQFFANGCTMADLIAQIAAGAANHGGFVSGVAHLTNQWVDAGLITGRQKGAIQSAAARTN